MLRNSLLGVAAFGLLSMAAGYVWTAFEFPFAIIVPAAVGWYVVARPDFGERTALWAALVGGVSFTVAFMFALFLALTDGSPIALSAWASAVLAAAAAGAVTGWLLGGGRGSIAETGFSALGMLAATVVLGFMRSIAPGSVDVAGPAQYAYFALSIGLVGALMGAAIGAGTSWVAMHSGAHERSTSPRFSEPHSA